MGSRHCSARRRRLQQISYSRPNFVILRRMASQERAVMIKETDEADFSEEEAARRRDEVIRRMVNTPPQHRATQKAQAKKALSRKKQAHRDRPQDAVGDDVADPLEQLSLEINGDIRPDPELEHATSSFE